MTSPTPRISRPAEPDIVPPSENEFIKEMRIRQIQIRKHSRIGWRGTMALKAFDAKNQKCSSTFERE